MENMDFEKVLGMASMFNGANKGKGDMDIASLLDMFLPKKDNEHSYNKHNLFENNYNESRDIKCLKSSVPYLQYNHQKNILMLIKLMEIKKLTEIYNTNERKTCSKNDLHGLLNDILPHIDEQQGASIKKCLNLMSIAERVK